MTEKINNAISTPQTGSGQTIRQAFWYEGEIAPIEANAVAQQSYEKLAQELIDSLYE